MAAPSTICDAQNDRDNTRLIGFVKCANLISQACRALLSLHKSS